MDWLHTWEPASSLVGFSLRFSSPERPPRSFRNETTVWMTPETAGRPGNPNAWSSQLAESPSARGVAPGAASWAVVPARWSRSRAVSHRMETPRSPERESIGESHGACPDVKCSMPLPAEPVRLRATQGGDFFYNFHHRLDQPKRRRLVVHWAAAARRDCWCPSSRGRPVIPQANLQRLSSRFRAQGERQAIVARPRTPSWAYSPCRSNLMITYTGLAPDADHRHGRYRSSPTTAGTAGPLGDTIANYPAGPKRSFNRSAGWPRFEAGGSEAARPLSAPDDVCRSSAAAQLARRPVRSGSKFGTLERRVPWLKSSGT